MEKFWGSTETVECRCTTANLPACNDAIILLIIMLLHRVSVIRNFVIPKRGKQSWQTDKKTSHFFVYTAGARPTIPTILGMAIEEVRTIFAPPNFFDPISSFAARGYWKFVGKCPHRGKMHNSVVCPPTATKLKTEKLPIDTYKIWQFRKNCTNQWPLRGKFMAKVRNFDSLGAVFPHFHISAPLNVKFGTGERTCQISRLSGQHVAPAGRKTYFWTTE